MTLERGGARVSVDAEPNTASAAPQLDDMPLPVASSAGGSSLLGPPVPPVQRVFFYSPEDWEALIAEWATGLAVAYSQIKRLGGPGDRGVDVAAFKTDRGLEDSWDCFQAKHYAKSLTLSDALPEMLKLFVGVVAGYYVLPDRYVFVAPRGCGASLNRLLSRPTELQSKFLEAVDSRGPSVRGIDEATLQSVRNLATTTDHSIFRSLELYELLDTHRTTPYYSARFGTALPARPPVPDPPTSPSPEERKYVQKLIEAYKEQDPTSGTDAVAVASHAKFGSHLQRQRESFYAAEALRVYARDSVPDGTFELLQGDVYSGVIDTAEADHASGLDRLRAVLTQSGQLDLGAHALISVSRIEDRQGICHQLANADRLTWVAGNG